MELEGNLSEFGVHAVLHFLSQGKLSGRLMLDDSEHQANLVVREGRIVDASGSQQVERLANLLGCEDGIKAKDIREIRSQMNSLSAASIGETLVGNNLLSEERWSDIAANYLQEHLRDLSLWTKGSFHFEKGAEGVETSKLAGIEPEPILEEFQLQAEEIQSLLASFPDVASHLQVQPLKRGDRLAIKLDPDEWRILAMIGRSSNFGAILQRSHLGRLATWRILNRLLQAQLVLVTLPSEASASETKRETLMDTTIEEVGDASPPVAGSSSSSRSNYQHPEPVLKKWFQMFRRGNDSVPM